MLVPSVLLARVLVLGNSRGAPCFSLVWLPAAWRTTNFILYCLVICAAAAMPFFTVAGSSTKVACVEAGGIILLTLAAGYLAAG